MLAEKVVNTIVLSDYQVTLTPVTLADQPLIRTWRNRDDIRSQMLSQDIISEEQQHAWFQRMQYDPKQLHWMVSFREQPIGVTNVKSLQTGKSVFDAEILEPGLYIGEPRYQGNLIAFAPTLAMYDYCFDALGTKCFRAVVKQTNQAALSYNQKLGYAVTKQGEYCELELTQADYQRHTAPIKQFLSRHRK
ncbi:MAG: GNAT family N-acetyltransferase [Pseudomonadota bacterium]|nr:GNAT family N-acetyltransferase [Pseudomonadota bacterium]